MWINIGHGSMETDVLIAAWMLVLLERNVLLLKRCQPSWAAWELLSGSWGEAETVSTLHWRI